MKINVEEILKNSMDVNEGWPIDFEGDKVINELVECLQKVKEEYLLSGEYNDKDNITWGLFSELIDEAKIVSKDIKSENRKGASRSLRVSIEIYSWLYYLLGPKRGIDSEHLKDDFENRNINRNARMQVHKSQNQYDVETLHLILNDAYRNMSKYYVHINNHNTKQIYNRDTNCIVMGDNNYLYLWKITNFQISILCVSYILLTGDNINLSVINRNIEKLDPSIFLTYNHINYMIFRNHNK